MTDFTEVGTIRRKAQNAGLMRIVEDSIKYAPKTIESIAIDTGLTFGAATLALNLLHTKDQVLLNGGLWYSIAYLSQVA
jgi:hypothetical protein